MYRWGIYLEGTYLTIWTATRSWFGGSGFQHPVSGCRRNWEGGCDVALLNICQPFVKLSNHGLWVTGNMELHTRSSFPANGGLRLVGEADVQVNNFGLGRRTATEIGTLCQRGTEDEVSGKFHLQIIFSPNWPWRGWRSLPISNRMVTTMFVLWVNKSCSETLDWVECESRPMEF